MYVLSFLASKWRLWPIWCNARLKNEEPVESDNFFWLHSLKCFQSPIKLLCINQKTTGYAQKWQLWPNICIKSPFWIDCAPNLAAMWFFCRIGKLNNSSDEIQLAQLCVKRWLSCVLGQYKTAMVGTWYWVGGLVLSQYVAVPVGNRCYRLRSGHLCLYK